MFNKAVEILNGEISEAWMGLDVSGYKHLLTSLTSNRLDVQTIKRQFWGEMYVMACKYGVARGQRGVRGQSFIVILEVCPKICCPLDRCYLMVLHNATNVFSIYQRIYEL